MRATRQPIADAEEAQRAQELIERLAYVDFILDRHDAVTSRNPAAWSQLGSDEAATRWLRVSHQLFSLLGMAADNMRVLREMLMADGEMVVPMFAHYPVIRSVIESAALVKWIAEPSDQVERLRRSLSARIADAKEDLDLHAEGMKAAALHGSTDVALLKRGDEKFAEGDRKTKADIREICIERGISWSRVKQGLPGYAKIITAVGATDEIPGNYAAAIWRIISGLSHPSASRAARFSALEVISESVDGVLHARLSASIQWTQSAVMVATLLTLDALRLVEERLDTKQPRRASAFGSIPAS